MDHATAFTAAGGIDLLDARGGQCRWVLEGESRRVCGARVAKPGESWCLAHRRLVYLPRASRKAEMRRINGIALASTRGAPQTIPNGWGW